MKQFQSNIPIYLQVMEIIKMQIISKRLCAGDKIASVRDLAIEFGVNPNTVQRALLELERENLLHAERTSGRFITRDEQLIAAIRTEHAKMQTQTYVSGMSQMGYTHDEMIKCINQERNEG